MCPKRPIHVLLDQVRITREGGDAVVDHADANISGVRITGIAKMTDADIVEKYNEILDAQAALLQHWDKTVVEEPPGEKQIEYHGDSDQWVSPAAMCFAASSTTVGRMAKSPSASTIKSCRSRSSAGCSACMSDGA
jgi:hypothetical protein